MKRFFWLGCVLLFYVICSGCGDTFRPIIIPNPPTFPDPRAAHTAVSINDNGTIAQGSAMVVDVSGDSDVSVANVGLVPVYAVQQTASQVLVVNHSVAGALADSITKLSFNSVIISNASTISLPANSAPNFVAVAPSDTTAYVTLPNYVPDPTTGVVVPSIGVVSTVSNNTLAILPVGNNPDAIAVMPDKTKFYVANQGSNSISAFNTIDRSPRAITGSFNAPLWVVARSDNQRVYVLNGNGVVSTIDTTSTAGPDNVIDASVTVPGAAYMVYDGNLNRLYIPGGTQLTILDVSQSTPVVLTGGPIPIPTVPSGSRLPFDPCSATGAQSLTVVAVTALPDGSRAYVGAFYTDASDNVCPQVTVIDAASNTVKSSIPVPGFPDATNPATLYYAPVCTPARSRFRFMMAAGGDSSRAYLASCDGGNVNIIDTSNDTYIQNLLAPVGSRAPIPPSPLNPPQNPVFLFAGP